MELGVEMEKNSGVKVEFDNQQGVSHFRYAQRLRATINQGGTFMNVWSEPGEYIFAEDEDEVQAYHLHTGREAIYNHNDFRSYLCMYVRMNVCMAAMRARRKRLKPYAPFPRDQECVYFVIDKKSTAVQIKQQLTRALVARMLPVVRMFM